jgi:hypothetical protein
MTRKTDFTMTFQTTRASQISDLAYEQAILAAENETPMDAELAATLNAGELRNEYERRQFKHDFRRHMRNIAEGNRFYLQ